MWPSLPPSHAHTRPSPSPSPSISVPPMSPNCMPLTSPPPSLWPPEGCAHSAAQAIFESQRSSSSKFQHYFMTLTVKMAPDAPSHLSPAQLYNLIFGPLSPNSLPQPSLLSHPRTSCVPSWPQSVCTRCPLTGACVLPFLSGLTSLLEGSKLNKPSKNPPVI